MEEIICVKDLSVRFDKKTVFKNVSFTLRTGQYLAVVGPNGAGKSTLIKAIVGQCRAFRGSVSIKNKRALGYVPQFNNDGSYFPAQVIEVIKSGFASRLFSFSHKSKDTDYMNLVIDALELRHILYESYFNLSGGQKRAVLIARALCSGASVLILDEPCASLDVEASDRLQRLISHLNRKHNISIILISHDIRSVIANADSILCLGQEPRYFSKMQDFTENNVLGELFSTDYD